MSPEALQLILLGLRAAPQIATSAGDLIAAVKGQLDNAQRAEIDAALEEAHRALQDARPGE